MEIRYCCQEMLAQLFADDLEAMGLHRLLFLDRLEYCPFCGAKIIETRLYGDE